MDGEPHRVARWLSGAGGARRVISARMPSVATRPRTAPVPLYEEAAGFAPLGPDRVDPTVRLPRGLAVVTVVRRRSESGRDAFGVSGRCEGVAPLPFTSGSKQLRPSAVGLGNAAAGGEMPSEILRAIGRWSANQGELAHWINRARGVHGDTLHVLIWDDTGFELPWETLWLPAAPERGLSGGLLGALVILSRWTTVHERARDLPTPGDCSGRVLGYFHREMRRDAEAFQDYAHQSHWHMSSFLSALECSGDATGLVYMACHGTYDDARISGLTLAGVTWSEFEERTMAVLSEDGSLVCLNACHSGRFIDNGAGGEETLRGFAELFLRKGAGGCIVTGGLVGESDARELIRQLVREVTAHPGRTVGQSLRTFRARAADGFGPLTDIPRTRHDDGNVDKDGQLRVLRLLYSFMFQFYGHPLTTLLLDARHDGARPGRNRHEP